MASDPAREFFQSYEAATRNGDAEALIAHYALPYTSFTLGHIGVFADREQALAAVAPHLKRLHDAGLDDVTLVDLAVTQVSPTFWLCHPTWEMRPRDGSAPLRFLNVYGLRVDERGPRFEFSIADNEATAIIARYPKAMPFAA